ncbi:DMT family transporter [Acinetobacter sp. NIPH1876]|uniref:DMT family transporter n=1 Tax=Acinetobacter TaxID=469 RepID=UPI001F4BB8CD|nr:MULTISPECIES: DMT family transporter [Acinetobacter]MCH7297276.1 DMT family transporter [Acinetobacter higginsii]MCH7341324.1 DMT family transporter [Acinetobacter higginsii]MCJ0827578.1 DMT family transporter [Acinetobacter sp. NIPH1876]
MSQLPEKNFISSTQIQPAVALVSPRLATVGQFIAVVLIWSFTPLAAVLTVHEIHWAWGLFFRFSIAIPLALICLFYFRQKLILTPQALISYGAGAVGLFGSMTFCYMGATRVSSGMISIIYGTAPLWSGLIAVFILKRERFLKRQWYGLTLAIFGLSLTLGIGADHIQLDSVGVLYEIIAVLLYVLSMFSVAKVGAEIHPIIQTTGSTLVSWFGYLCLLPFFLAEAPTQFPSLQTSLALLYSALFSSVLAMIFYFHLIQKLNPTTVMLITILTPVFATCWGFLFNHEPLSSHLIIGLMLLCFGLFLYAYRNRPRPQ